MINVLNKENLDLIFCFYMKSFLRKNKYGVDGLKADVENLDQCVISFIACGIDLIKNGYSPLEIDFILECEMLKIRNQEKKNYDIIYQLTLAKRLSVYLQKEDIGSFLEFENLFGVHTREYLCLTFIPNLPLAVQEKYELGLFIENIPFDKLQLNNY